MIVVVGDEIELRHLARALADHVLRHGREHVPASFPTLVDALSRQMSPNGDVAFDSDGGGPDDRLVTYSTAARRLGVSQRTVSRRVAAGTLVTVGRRIMTSSVEAMAGSASGPPRSPGGPDAGH